MKRHNSDDQLQIELIQDNDQLTLISEVDEEDKSAYFLKNAIYYTQKLLQLLLKVVKTKQNALTKEIQNNLSKQSQHIKQYLSKFRPITNQILSKEELVQNYEKVKTEFKAQCCKAFSIYSTQDEQLANNSVDQQLKESEQMTTWSINENKTISNENTENTIDNSFKIYSDLEQNQIQIQFPKRISQEYQKDLLKKLDEIAKHHQYQCVQLK
ncbi:unnamed protein product (macronuclear) [Paramecium tetraurelia]|uniref:Uncharacterized protein n=1 Tax=Paramecium tetraurelia TaxID=5888 RepID=A0C320_PARTE|nr:uncharacterized protein GSPATT00034665001 [Paramecium tetraurelia]CAK65187.1 unnamed protein product [Paramecium tetraurelia]|eukprot:XP_001432584.1 hypothetical protein (macronuclear) [Paramecium tetraurelia strain d4-2]